MGLNAAGRVQCARLEERFRDERVDHLFSSPLSRARETAAAVRGSHPTPIPVLFEDLQEFGFGQWEGCTEADIRRDSPDLHQRWFSSRDFTAVPGGEGLEGFRARVRGALDSVLEVCLPGQTAVVVSHIWLIAVALDTVFGSNTGDPGGIRRSHNAALTTVAVRGLNWEPGATELMIYNDTRHLARSTSGRR